MEKATKGSFYSANYETCCDSGSNMGNGPLLMDTSVHTWDCTMPMPILTLDEWKTFYRTFLKVMTLKHIRRCISDIRSACMGLFMGDMDKWMKDFEHAVTIINSTIPYCSGS
jgi:hypothetical protein